MKNHFKTAVFAVLACLGLVLLPTGCTSGVPIDASLSAPDTTLRDDHSSDGTRLPLVRIEYPVALDEASATAIVEAWRDSECGMMWQWKGDLQKMSQELVALNVRQMLTKSHYYALEFYLHLKDRMPPGTVVLVPQVLRAGEKGVVATPAVEPVPTPVVVKFSMYASLVATQRDRYAQVFYETFANWFSPEVVIEGFGGSDAAAGSRDFLASTAFFEMAPGEVEGLTLATRLNLGGERAEQWGDVPDDIKPRLTEQRPAGVGQAFRLVGSPRGHVPLFIADEVAVRDYARASSAAPETSVLAPVWQYYGNVIFDYLNSVDAPLGPPQGQRYLRSVLGVESDQEAMVALARCFIEVESRFVAEQDAAYAEEAYGGAFGRSMRSLLDSEMAWYEAKDAASSQMLMQGLTAASLSFAGNYGAAQGTLTPGQNLQMQMSAMSINFSALRQNERTAAELQGAFARHLARILEVQHEYSVDVGGSEQRIRASSIGELRRRFVQILRTR